MTRIGLPLLALLLACDGPKPPKPTAPPAKRAAPDAKADAKGAVKDGAGTKAEASHVVAEPTDALFLHRKIGGLYLLAARLGARVDIRGLFLRHAVGSPG